MSDEVAEYVLQEARVNPRLAALVEDATMFDALQDHVGWKRLFEKIQKQKDGFLGSLARRLMSGEVVDQREIDFMRGYYQGALEAIEKPRLAMESLERAARRAWTQALLEAENSDTEGDEPL